MMGLKLTDSIKLNGVVVDDGAKVNRFYKVEWDGSG